MKELPIGIFDSGIGGLTVAHAIKKELPYENIIYFGDTKHLPYGEKSAEAIIDFSKNIISFLKRNNTKAIVIACNSASSVAADIIYKKEKKIPIFNVIEPVVNYVSKKCQNSKVGVIGTKATIQSKVYEEKIKKLSLSIKISSLATPLLAPMIEEGFIKEDISSTIIKQYLSNSKLKNINHLILGCTHYPLIYNEIKKFYNSNVNIIDSAKIIAKQISRELHEKNLVKQNNKTKHYFFVSNYTKEFEKSAKFFFKEGIKLEEVNI